MSDKSDATKIRVPANAARLREFTPARVGLGRTGVSQQMRDVLDFQRAHAQARDAVHTPMNPADLQAAIAPVIAKTYPAAAKPGTRDQGNEGPGRPGSPPLPVLRLRSAAPDRATYLQRPDLGRLLDESSRRMLHGLEPTSYDMALIVADGLSALAVERHVAPLLTELLPQVGGWTLAPVCIVEQGRVAIGDEIGWVLHAEMSVVL